MGYARSDITNTYQWCRLVRKNKGIIKADWLSMVSGSTQANCSINKVMFLFSPIFRLEYHSVTVYFIANRSP